MAEENKTPLRAEEIESILAAHRLWLESDSREGKCADFTGKIIVNHSFANRALQRSTFYNAVIVHCDFSGANLNDTSFISAEVARSSFSKAKLDCADFSWARISGCDLSDTEHLTVKSFKRTNLYSSKLPADFLFENVIEYTNDLIKKSRNTFIACLSFSIATLLLILFGIPEGDPTKLSVQLPLIGKSIGFSREVGLAINLVAISVLWSFFSLALCATKKQLDKLPSVFPDGRFAYETVFPWFWVTWITEIWQSNPKNEKHQLWQRLFILSAAANVLYLSVFVALVALCLSLPALIDVTTLYPCFFGAILLILFAATLFAAYHSRDKAFVYFAAIEALLAWALIFYFTNLSTMFVSALCMIVAWWWDKYTFSNEPFSLDLSAPEAQFYSKELKDISAYVESRFAFANVTNALVLATLCTLYMAAGKI